MFLSAQSKEEKPQYLLPEFRMGTMLLKNDSIQKVIFNYNIVSELMVYEKDGKYFDLMNPDILDTIYINDRKFVPVGKIFHEVLFIGNKLSLCVQHKGALVDLGKPSGYGGTSQTSSIQQYSSINASGQTYNLKLPDNSEVRTEDIYWIIKPDGKSSFTTEKQLLKIFPDKEKELNLYIKEQKIKIRKPEDVVRLVSYLNTL
jgi:hypothetical protein